MCDPNTTCTCGASFTPWLSEETQTCVDPTLQPSVSDASACVTPNLTSDDVAVLPTLASAFLSCGQATLFGPQESSIPDIDEIPPLIPPEIIERMLIRPPAPSVERESPIAPPSTAISLVEGPNGQIEVASQYFTTVRDGGSAVAELHLLLQELSSETDPMERRRMIENAERMVERFGQAATQIYNTHTRQGLSEYQTIENWVNHLYGERRAVIDGSPLSQLPVTNESHAINMDAVMLGFNLAGINRVDHNYQRGTGTVVKYLIEYSAREVAPQFGGRSLGMWGTNVAVTGIEADQVDLFRRQVQDRVIEHLRQNTIPEEVTRRVYGMASEGTSEVPTIRTADLEARDWLVRQPHRMGLVAGHHSTAIDAASVVPGEVELRVISALEGAGEAEAEARRTGRRVHTGAVPEDSPVRGRAGRPLLRADAIIEGDPTRAEAVERGAYVEQLTPEAIRNGQLPNPAREASVSVYHYQQLARMIEGIGFLENTGETMNANAGARDMIDFLENPTTNRRTGADGVTETGTVQDILTRTFEASIQQHRFPGIFRLEFFPELARRTFNGERMYIQMFEYRDYWGHNREHTADARDSLHRITLDIQVEGFRYQGVEVLVGTNGGDEVAIAIRGKNAQGEQLSQTDIGRISDHLATQFNRIFEALEHHHVVKAPLGEAGGMFEGRPYVIQEGRIYMQDPPSERSSRQRLLESIQIAHNRTMESGDITRVQSLSDIANVERLRLWRQTTNQGHVVEVLVPEGVRPEGFVEVRIPLSTTVTPAVEIPAGASNEFVELALHRVGDMAESMKQAGQDRPPYTVEQVREARMQGLEIVGPVVELSLLERISSTHEGRIAMDMAMSGGMFIVGEFGSDALLTAFGEGSMERYSTAEGWFEVAGTGAIILTSAKGAEALARRGLRIPSGVQATGMRGLGVRGASYLGPILMLSAIESDNPEEFVDNSIHMGLAIGEAALVVRGGYALARRVGVGLAARAGVTWVAGAAATSASTGWGIAISGALLIGEFAYMKYRANQDLEEALLENVTDTRADLAEAMADFDRIVESGNFMEENFDGELVPTAEFTEALETVNERSGAYLMSLRIHNSDAGRDYVRAHSELEEEREDLSEIRSRPRHAYEGKYTNHYDGAVRNAERAVDSAREEVEAAEARFDAEFETMVADRPSSTPTVPFVVRTNASAGRNDYSGYLSSDPSTFYYQYAQYIQSRGHRITEVAITQSESSDTSHLIAAGAID